MRKISYDPLWKKLIDAKMTKTELAKACGVSRTTIAKISKNESVCLDVILKICNVLDCNVTDVLSILPEGGSDTSSRSQVK
jgi:DNA-binding Xre family transcriptional regulator